MGWSSGSPLMSRVIEAVAEHVPNNKSKLELFVDLIEAFEDFDCDTLDECLGEDAMFDAAYKEVYGHEEDED